MCRKSFALCMFFIVGVASLALALYAPGWGMRGSAAVTTARADGFTANQLKISNLDATNYIFVLVNCSTSVFDAAVATTNCVPIAPSTSYTFDYATKGSIDSFCYATTNGTAAFDAAAF